MSLQDAINEREKIINANATIKQQIVTLTKPIDVLKTLYNRNIQDINRLNRQIGNSANTRDRQIGDKKSK